MGGKLCFVVALCVPLTAWGYRPVLSGSEEVFDTPDGRVRFHYTLSGEDALLSEGASDVDPPNGVPDFIDDSAEGIDRAYQTFVVQDGWHVPPPDDGRGGDDRFDVYVRAIDARGYAHYEATGEGGEPHTSYLELSPTNAARFGRVVARSIAAHEYHHALQAAITTRAGDFLAEATATWAQYQLYPEEAGLQGALDVLWGIRLGGAGRALTETGGQFEYAGLVWIKFLVEHGGTERAAVLDLWKDMALEPGFEPGIERALPRFGLDSLGGAAEVFAEWNLFACARNDGHHYLPTPLPCTLEFEVPATSVGDLPATGRTDAIGSFGAAYLDVEPDCSTNLLRLRATAPGRFSVRAVKARARGGSVYERADSVDGTCELAIEGSNDVPRTVFVLVNLDDTPISFDWSIDGEGAYVPHPDPEGAETLRLRPSGRLFLRVGESRELAASGVFNSCADRAGPVVTDRVSFTSSNEEVAGVVAGVVTAVAPGLASIVAYTAEVESNRVEVEVTETADSGNGGETDAGSADSGVPPADGPVSESQEDGDSGGCACASVGL